MSDVFFVGCGPGDPDLITIKAKKLIQKADVVVYSGSLIPEPIIKLCKKGKLYDAAKLVREEIFDLLYKNAKKDKLVVRLHDGDPAIYGAIREQIDNLEKKGIKSTVVPGVTSFLASAAALGTQLTLPGVTQTMIITRAEARTKVPKREQISELAKHQATLIFYLSVHLLNKISKEAIEGGYKKTTPVAVVYRASRKDQKIIIGNLSDIASKVKAEKITILPFILVSQTEISQLFVFKTLPDPICVFIFKILINLFFL